MITNLTDEEKIQYLIDFQEEIAKIYETGIIRGPIHLRTGGEPFLINLFKKITKKDYVFATWANNREALLKEIPKEKVKQRILDGHSMAMNFPEYNFYSSAIVGGTCSISTGVAYALKQQQKSNRVYSIIGDMCFLGGAAHESIQYSIGYDLPISWIISDNDKSVCSPTRKTWNVSPYDLYVQIKQMIEDYDCKNCEIEYFQFESKWPHSAIGSFISF